MKYLVPILLFTFPITAFTDGTKGEAHYIPTKLEWMRNTLMTNYGVPKLQANYSLEFGITYPDTIIIYGTYTKDSKQNFVIQLQYVETFMDAYKSTLPDWTWLKYTHQIKEK